METNEKDAKEIIDDDEAMEETDEIEDTNGKNDIDIIEKLREKQKELKRLGEELAKKSEEYDVLYDKYVRVSAEYDNFRKRTAKEKEGIYSEAAADVLSHILPIADNMERALQFSEAEKVFDGLKMIYAQFADSLVRLGVEEIKAGGEQFDPSVHNAVMHEEDESKPDNTVTEVLQKGYIRGDKVIRPAMVKVVN